MTAAESNTKPRVGRPKDSVKRLAIIEAAIRLFLDKDFVEVTMDNVAAEANVSKLTVYSHFRDKEMLYAEAVRHHAMNFIVPVTMNFPDNAPLREIVKQVAAGYFDNLIQERNVEGFRILLLPRVRAAGIADLAWKEGPARMIAALAELLEQRAAKGELTLVDPAESAAIQMLTFIRGNFFHELILGVRTTVSDEERETHLQVAVRNFCLIYCVS